MKDETQILKAIENEETELPPAPGSFAAKLAEIKQFIPIAEENTIEDSNQISVSENPTTEAVSLSEDELKAEELKNAHNVADSLVSYFKNENLSSANEANTHKATENQPPPDIIKVAVEIPQNTIIESKKVPHKPKKEEQEGGIRVDVVEGWITKKNNGETLNLPPLNELKKKKYANSNIIQAEILRQEQSNTQTVYREVEPVNYVLKTEVSDLNNSENSHSKDYEENLVSELEVWRKNRAISVEGKVVEPQNPEEDLASQVEQRTHKENELTGILRAINTGEVNENNIELLKKHREIIEDLLAGPEKGAHPRMGKDIINELKEKHLVLPVPPVEEIEGITPAQPEIKKDLSWNQEVVDSLTLVPKEEKASDTSSSSHDPMNRYWDANMPSLVTEKEREGKLNFDLTPKKAEPVSSIMQSVSTEGVMLSAIPNGEVAQIETVEKVINQKQGEVAPLIATRFAEAFGINHEQLEDIEGFSNLSVGKQLLILKNMQSEALLDVTRGAEKEQKEEWQGRSLWGKIWRSALTMGSYEFARTKAMEKEILARAKGVNPADFKRIEALATQIANIQEYVKVVETLPEVKVKEGETLEMQYVSAKNLLGSIEDERLTSENLKTIEEFNISASGFASTPHEWGYEPSDEKTRRERAEYDKKREDYSLHRAKLLSMISENAKQDGETNPERTALLAVNRIDEQMELNQLFSAHPRVEEVLGKIENQNAILAGVKEFWRDKGFYVALGAATRIGVGSVLGSLTGGLGALLALGVGAGVGQITGESEARKIIRNRRIDRRLSEEDEREEISYEVVLRNENNEIVLGPDGKPLTEGKTRKIKEFTDAGFFIDRIERLTDKLHEAQTPEEQTLLESKIVKTTAVMNEKYNQGLINFGGSSLEAGDARKGNTIANKLSFIQALGKGAAVEVIDGEKLKAEVEQMVSSHQEKIEQVRNGEVVKAGKRAAYIRGAFALGGVLIVEGVQQVSTIDDGIKGGFIERIFGHTTGANEEVVSNIEIPFHSYTSDEIAHVREVILSHKSPDFPQEVVDSNNQAYAKGVEEYMKSTDPAIRHLTAETLTMTDKQMEEEVAKLIKENSIPSHVTEAVALPKEVTPPTPLNDAHITEPAKEIPPLERGVHVPQPIEEPVSQTAPAPQSTTPIEQQTPPTIEAIPDKWEPIVYTERHLPPPPDSPE